ncbi:MAG: TetR/AcrR family transcriptional regulator [Bacteroidota bacterium]
MKNKEKILLSATNLFNEMGVVNVRLQHISDDTIISLGNIAYHFKNKEAIVSTIFEAMEKSLKEALIEYRHTPIFANMDRIFGSIEEVQSEYGFFFSDLIEIKRNYPKLFEKIFRFFSWQEFLFHEIIHFNVSRGAFKPIERQEEKAFLAKLLVQSINLYPASKLLWTENLTDNSSLSFYIWQILLPFMTNIGREEYNVLVNQKIQISDSTDESSPG